MANIIFQIGGPDDKKLLKPHAMRLEIMNSGGKELAYIQSSVGKDDMQAGFAYGKKDTYKKHDDYPRTRENFILDAHDNYQAALARYQRAIYLYKASTSTTEKKRTQAYMTHCYQKALALYKKEIAKKKNAQ